MLIAHRLDNSIRHYDIEIRCKSKKIRSLSEQTVYTKLCKGIGEIVLTKEKIYDKTKHQNKDNLLAT